jgi:hypothetical protein
MSHFGKKMFDVESDIPDLSGKVILVTGGEFESFHSKSILGNRWQATLA